MKVEWWQISAQFTTETRAGVVWVDVVDWVVLVYHCKQKGSEWKVDPFLHEHARQLF